MKKILITFIFIVGLCSNSFSDNFKIGQKIENELRFSKKISFPLKSGVWEIIDRDVWFLGSINIRLITLALIKNDKLLSVYEFQVGDLSGGYQSDIDLAIHEWLYGDKYDGCYKRSEYTLLKKFTKGSSHNCLVVRHINPTKEIYTPDDSTTYVERRRIRKYLENNNIILPNNMLVSNHVYMSRLVSNNLYSVTYMDNPQILSAPKNNFKSEETSEYHPSNINKYPEYKKYMDKFIEISSSRHIEFEKIVNAKKRHKLKFINIDSNTVKDDKILDQLDKLNTLYKDGVLTKEEFAKAKKKILNK
jgi:hypothetical protein